MLHSSLIKPTSIAVIGGSNNSSKPGGKIVTNLLAGTFDGNLFIVNPKENEVQGIQCFKSVDDLPNVDLAILAIPARFARKLYVISLNEKIPEGLLLFPQVLAKEMKKDSKLKMK